MDLKSFVGNTATVVTIGSFLSGSVVCKKIIKNQTSGELSPLPFVAGTLCAALWLRYGLYLDDSSLIYVNATGLLLNLAYTFCFYLYAVHKSVFQKQIFIAGGFLLFLTIYLTYISEDIRHATYLTGMTACAGSLLFFGSPLVALADVLRTKSVESLPFPVISSTFCVSALWFLYGILIHDVFIQVPNFIGVLLTGFQLSLFAMYPSGRGRAE